LTLRHDDIFINGQKLQSYIRSRLAETAPQLAIGRCRVTIEMLEGEND